MAGQTRKTSLYSPASHAVSSVRFRIIFARSQRSDLGHRDLALRWCFHYIGEKGGKAEKGKGIVNHTRRGVQCPYVMISNGGLIKEKTKFSSKIHEQ